MGNNQTATIMILQYHIQRCLWVTLMLWYIPANATGALARRIDVAFNNTPLKTALAEVARKGEFEWSYNPRLIDPNRPVTLTVSRRSVREVLSDILGDQYRLKENGNYVILTRQAKPHKELSGYISDPESGKRVVNATVYDRRTLRAVITDSSGYYALKVKKHTEIVVARLGYRDTILQITPLTPRNQPILLQPIPNQKKEPTNRSLFGIPLSQYTSRTAQRFGAVLNRWYALNVPDSLHRRFQVSLLPYVGANHTLTGKVENDFSVNIIAGYSAGVRVAEVAGVANFTRNRVRGIQAAGAFNELQGNCTGVQYAGVFNVTEDTLRGAQAAGVFNFAYNTSAIGIQAAGVFNVSIDNNGGLLQGAGLFNIAREIKGAQVAGLLNLGIQDVYGVQAAGLINHVDNLRGVQIAGILNRAKSVRGVQIGLINSARSVKGLQIGLINRSGRRVLPFLNW
jgi:CarboxypepD_reg-like domain